jgi:hypothetical protein
VQLARDFVAKHTTRGHHDSKKQGHDMEDKLGMVENESEVLTTPG